MKNFINDLGILYALSGALGALILRVRRKMSFLRFVGLLAFSSLFGWAVGNGLDHFTSWNSNLVYSVCAITGVFADEIYSELAESISSLSEIIKKRMGGTSL